MIRSLLTSLSLAAMSACCLAGTAAQAMTVQPVIVDLSTAGGRMSAVVTVENSFATALPVELKAVEADFKDGGLIASTRDADDLLIFPPQALIQPGRTQSFRVQWVGEPEIATSKHFFLTVAQLPVKLPEGQSAVQILYNFQVIVSVGAPGAKPEVRVAGTEQTKGEDGKVRLTLNLENQSNTYGYLSEGTLKISEKDASGKEVMRQTLTGAEILQQMGYGLVGPGQKRRLQTPIELPVEGGTVEAIFSPRSR
ncbi:molecular chaperone [Sphingobium limneticum]|jgi:fimbrial chaperone protein|uniref:Molecular chaperone n=1 Tax=Sphingobium limneticum TaxID=1007511 RepID=A0A5J5HYU3_9SPHN|nr:molecular chaperone [Sphingobium limneticum]KAA9014340.1 molecular chaperone [Sphingobium limneticum]KAA9027429.1 molecular chaperone [Sphingobium limneticum]